MLKLKPIIGADSPDGYRNKAQYPVGRENGETENRLLLPPLAQDS